jgi:hypothetical protein
VTFTKPPGVVNVPRDLSTGWFDVRDYGSLTPAATAQATIRSASQAAINYCQAGTGRSAIVYVPYAVDVDTTAGRCGDFPANVDVEVWGRSTGKVNGTSGTVLRRTAGHNTNEIFNWEGSDASSNRSYGALRHIELNGNQATATKPLLRTYRVNEFDLDGRLADCTGTAWQATQLWNSRGKAIIFRCGNGTTPAILMDGITAESSTDTPQLTDFQWELCLGTEIKFTGDTSFPCNKVRLNAPKIERGGQGHQAGATMNYPIFNCEHVTALVITAPDIYLQTPSGGGTNTSKVLVGGTQAASTQGLVEILGGSIVTDGNPTHLFDFTGGNRYALIGTYLQGDSVSTAFVKIASTLNSDAVQIQVIIGSGTVQLVDDQRNDTQLGWGQIQLLPRSLSGAAWAVDGNVPVIEFRESQDDKAYYVAELPADMRRQQTVKLQMMTSYDATGGFAFFVATVQRKIALSGTIGDTSGPSSPQAQIAPPGTADQARKNTLAPTLSFSPGEVVVVVLERRALTVPASDTTTAKARLSSLVLLYPKNL